MDLGPVLAEFFSTRAPLEPGQRILVAFSGGADSTALLASLKDLSRSKGFEVHAGHVDHGLDHDAPRRAADARELCRRLRLPFHLCRPPTPPEAEEGPEAAARRMRYRALETLRRTLGARYLATAHHRDDQAETVALRITFGTRLGGLAGIQPVHRRILRPLLRVPHHALVQEVQRRGLPFVSDPTNEDLKRPRNLLRHRVLPALEEAEPALRLRLTAVAAASERARRIWHRALYRRLEPVPVESGWGMPLGAFRRLPEEVRDLALDLLHRLAGNPYPATAAARWELWRQLEAGGRIGVDCGSRWRWERRGKLLVVVPHATPTPFFSYTLEVPGEVCIEELGISFSLSPARKPELTASPRSSAGGSPAPGLLRVVHRALFSKDLNPGGTITLRNRRPGDSMIPPGARSARPLKELLHDRRVPLSRRDRLLLVCTKGVIAWIPGLGLDERFRPGRTEPLWLAEISAHEQ